MKMAQLIFERASILEPEICVQKPQIAQRGGQGFGSKVLLLLRLPFPLTRGRLLEPMHGLPCHAEPMDPGTTRFSAFRLSAPVLLAPYLAKERR